MRNHRETLAVVAGYVWPYLGILCLVQLGLSYASLATWRTCSDGYVWGSVAFVVVCAAMTLLSERAVTTRR